jgi:hypothetical protein
MKYVCCTFSKKHLIHEIRAMSSSFATTSFAGVSFLGESTLSASAASVTTAVTFSGYHLLVIHGYSAPKKTRLMESA